MSDLSGYPSLFQLFLGYYIFGLSNRLSLKTKWKTEIRENDQEARVSEDLKTVYLFFC